MAITHIGVIGDSLTQGTLYGFNLANGGTGTWAEQVAASLGALGTWGPLISPGLRLCLVGTQNAFPDGEWTFSGTIGGGGGSDWATTGVNYSYVKQPYGFGLLGNGSSKVATYHVTVTTLTAVVGFDIWWVDYADASHTAGPWSYRIDGGAWTACPDTPTRGNAVRKFYVNSPITSTVEIRCADTSGTDAGCLPLGITPYWVNPTNATSGIILNNYGGNGQVLNTQFTDPNGTNYFACLDAVTLGSGSPISSNPNLTTCMFVNDVGSVGNVVTWDIDTRAYINRCKALGPTIVMSPWECSTGSYPIATQAAYRAQTLLSANAVGAQTSVFDFYRAYSSEGVTGNTATSALYLQDTLHLNQAGHNDVAKRMFPLIVRRLRRTPHNAGANTGKTGFNADSGMATSGVAW